MWKFEAFLIASSTPGGILMGEGGRLLSSRGFAAEVRDLFEIGRSNN